MCAQVQRGIASLREVAEVETSAQKASMKRQHVELEKMLANYLPARINIQNI